MQESLFGSFLTSELFGSLLAALQNQNPKMFGSLYHRSPKSDYTRPTSIKPAGDLGICQIADLFIATTGGQEGSQYHINCKRLNFPVMCIHPFFPPTFNSLFPLWSVVVVGAKRCVLDGIGTHPPRPSVPAAS